MKNVIEIIKDRIDNAKKQIEWDKNDILNGNNAAYKQSRIKNNTDFIIEAEKAILILNSSTI